MNLSLPICMQPRRDMNLDAPMGQRLECESDHGVNGLAAGFVGLNDAVFVVGPVCDQRPSLAIFRSFGLDDGPPSP